MTEPSDCCSFFGFGSLTFTVRDAMRLLWARVPAHVNQCACEWPIQRMCDPLGTKDPSVGLQRPSTYSDQRCQEVVGDVRNHLRESCVTPRCLFSFSSWVRSSDGSDLNEVTATPTSFSESRWVIIWLLSPKPLGTQWGEHADWLGDNSWMVWPTSEHHHLFVVEFWNEIITILPNRVPHNMGPSWKYRHLLLLRALQCLYPRSRNQETVRRLFARELASSPHLWVGVLAAQLILFRRLFWAKCWACLKGFSQNHFTHGLHIYLGDSEDCT